MRTSISRSWRLLMLSIATYWCLAVASVQAEDWPQWRGPNRDGKSADTGLLKEWPAGGPKLAWKATGLGNGYSSMSTAAGKLFTMGDKDGVGYVIALNAADGKILWSARVGSAGAPGAPGWSYPGPRCTPTVSGDLVFALDAWGEMICVTVADGKEQWRKSFTKDFGGQPPTWGYSESPLVDGEQVVVTPGGSQGAMVALDRKTGRVLWWSKDFTDEAHYSSIVMAEIGGERQCVQLTAASVVGISPKDGSVLWKAPRKGNVAVIPTPIVDGDRIYVTSGYNAGSHLFKVAANAGKFSVEQVWSQRAMANHHGGVVKVGDYLYGYSDSRGLACQNFQTGEIVWSEKEKIKKGCVSYADGALYCREEDTGTMVLVEASPSGYKERGRFAQPDRAKEKAWPHPTIANGKLYLRDQDTLLCYDVK
ncbi:MAG: PQQ-like beta-propeller repeat protein [Sedimentisphaerales bacterium]|nr:PQQ-like beta-propeller repeat protein [Sedimentisphaerales bacterium]